MDDTHQSAVDKTVCEFVSKNPSVKTHHVDASMLLAELNIDSLEKLSIGMDLEDEFAIEFTDDEIEAFLSVADIIKAVKLALAAKTDKQVPAELLEASTSENLCNPPA
jgi:acyl carrier protein